MIACFCSPENSTPLATFAISSSLIFMTWVCFAANSLTFSSNLFSSSTRSILANNIRPFRSHGLTRFSLLEATTMLYIDSNSSLDHNSRASFSLTMSGLIPAIKALCKAFSISSPENTGLSIDSLSITIVGSAIILEAFSKAISRFCFLNSVLPLHLAKPSCTPGIISSPRSACDKWDILDS